MVGISFNPTLTCVNGRYKFNPTCSVYGQSDEGKLFLFSVNQCAADCAECSVYGQCDDGKCDEGYTKVGTVCQGKHWGGSHKTISYCS